MNDNKTYESYSALLCTLFFLFISPWKGGSIQSSESLLLCFMEKIKSNRFETTSLRVHDENVYLTANCSMHFLNGSQNSVHVHLQFLNNLSSSHKGQKFLL